MKFTANARSAMRPWLRQVAALVMLSTSASASAAISYLALGDSYTIGEGVPTQARWPDQLQGMLRAKGLAIADPQIIAKTGWTTDELSAAMDAAQKQGKLRASYGYVSLLIGVNNQYRGRDLANYREEFTQLLSRAIALSGGQPRHVFVLSIPDWGATAFGLASGRNTTQIARELDAYNELAREICTARHVLWIDITDLTRKFGTLPEMLVADGLHPSAAMYQLWAERVSASFP